MRKTKKICSATTEYDKNTTSYHQEEVEQEKVLNKRIKK